LAKWIENLQTITQEEKDHTKHIDVKFELL